MNVRGRGLTCYAKRVYGDRPAATRAARVLRRRWAGARVAEYRCRDCQGWHLGGTRRRRR